MYDNILKHKVMGVILESNFKIIYSNYQKIQLCHLTQKMVG
jgi:hypothetical protein